MSVHTLVCASVNFKKTHLATQDVEVVGGCGHIHDLPVGVLDLCAQVAS